MNWTFFICITIASLLVAWFEWPKLKQKPKRERVIFVSLLLFVWVLSMFDLTHTPGPTTVLQTIFKPFKGLLEQ
ncbi:hypothetical protein [Paenibacillus sp. SI8]|uniref:hypothetical protein n=1 Tax=unclassified Paenibacillus TaxID=185978 RepID=UPI00346567B7